MNLFSGLLNMGAHAAWISNTMDKFSGKSAYLYNAKSTLLGSDASSLKYDEVVNLITQYDATDKTSWLFKTSTAPGTSAYFMYNAFVVVAKVIYTNLLADKYNIYSSQLGDTAYFAQGVVTPVGKTFFIFLFNIVKESLKWGNEGTLVQIAYSSKDPQTDVSSYINNTFFIGGMLVMSL